MLKLEANLMRFNQAMSRFDTELGMMPGVVVKDQAGLLMAELVRQEGPKDLATLERNIDRDVKKKFATMPAGALTASHRQGKGFVWLLASPYSLTGVKPERFKLEANADSLKKLYYTEELAKQKYSKIGRRGKQAVVELNRIVVRKGVLQQFKKLLKSAGGKLKASWALAWPTLQPKGRRPPKWVMRHVGGKAKGGFINGLGFPGKATFTLISRATGVEQPHSKIAVNKALTTRFHKMSADIKLYLKGIKKRVGFKRQ